MIDETLFDAEEKMEKAVSVAKDDLATLRTGRGVHQGADGGPTDSFPDVAVGQQVEDDDRHVIVHAVASRL